MIQYSPFPLKNNFSFLKLSRETFCHSGYQDFEFCKYLKSYIINFTFQNLSTGFILRIHIKIETFWGAWVA